MYFFLVKANLSVVTMTQVIVYREYKFPLHSYLKCNSDRSSYYMIEKLHFSALTLMYLYVKDRV